MERANLYPDVSQSDTAVGSNEKRILTAQPPPSPVGSASSTSTQLNLSQLIDKLNAINFLDRSLYINFRHKQYQRSITYKAKPNPCRDNRLSCLWQQDVGNLVAYPELYTFENIIIPDGNSFLVATPEVIEIANQRIDLLLPETCTAEDARSYRRH